MNILIVTPIFPPEIGGPATYVSELTSRLSKNHQVAVITFTKNSATRNSKLVTYISTQGNPLTRQCRLFRTLLVNARLADVIYAQGTIVVGVMSLFVSLIWRKKLIIKFVGDELWEAAFNSNQTTHSLEHFYLAPRTSHLKRLLVFFHRLVLRSAHKIIVPSRYLKDFLITSHQVKPRKIAVISNAVEVNPQPATRNSLLLVTIGRLAKTKNIDQIIQALALARQTKPWKLTIIGDGPEKNNLKLQIKNLKLDHAVTFTGSLSEAKVQQLIVKSQKLILMSSYEGQSHTLIQALLLKTPIIASDIPPNRELVGNYGHLVPLNNTQALAAVINQPSAYALVKKNFSWAKHLQSLIQIISSHD